MKRKFMIALALLLVAGLFSSVNAKNGNGNQAQSTASDDKTAPSYDMKAQALVDLQMMQKKYTELAQSIPVENLRGGPSRMFVQSANCFCMYQPQTTTFRQ
jgi:hypothetical protein